MEKTHFKNFDLSDFWEESEYSKKEYEEEFPNDELIATVESELGYKLPASYIELMKLQNGGIPKNDCFPTNESTSWSEDHVAISGIMGIGLIKTYSLCGELGSQFMIDEWGYPAIGVYFGDCPSAGHDMILLDYSNCGNDGEPEVVHVDQESDYKMTFLAKNFEEFIRGLVSSEEYDTSEQDLIDDLENIKSGRFSDILESYFKKDTSVDFDAVLRKLFAEIATEKGYFALHGDPSSLLAYDIQFYLLSINERIKSKIDWEKLYPMIAVGNNEISTGGYSSFHTDWFSQRIKENRIKMSIDGFIFSDEYKLQLFDKINKYA